MEGPEYASAARRESSAGSLVALLHTGRVAAEVTVERLQVLGIEARILDLPNVFVRLTSGGNYRVRVVVPEPDLARARGELERWAEEARPRVRQLAREVQLVLVSATLAAAAVGGALFWLGVPRSAGWAVGLWAVFLAGWVARSRRGLERVP